MKKFYPLRIFCENAWDWSQDGDKDDYEDSFIYTAEFLGEYTTKIRAVVSADANHLWHHDGHYGVLWIEVESYECEPPYLDCNLKDMLHVIDMAEKNLLAIGMPFTPEYEFQSNQGNRKRRNEKLRRIYGLEEKEKKDLDEFKQWQERKRTKAAYDRTEEETHAG